MERLAGDSHKNVVRAIGAPFVVSMAGRGDRLCQMFELCDTDLMSVVEAHGGALAEATSRGVFQQIVLGLRHCHSRGVYHVRRVF